MERQEYMGSRITIRKIQQGQAKIGCDPRGFQILFKESGTTGGSPNFAYLRNLLEGKGYRVTEGDRIANTPMTHLCVASDSVTVTREEIIKVLEKDQEIDLTNIDRPEKRKE